MKWTHSQQDFIKMCEEVANHHKNTISYTLDHLAFRTENRNESVELLSKLFDYSVQEEFLPFADSSNKDNIDITCAALSPPVDSNMPEIFVSSGNWRSIVGDWVKNRKDVGGIHHIAVKIPAGTIEEIMEQWKQYDIEFTTEKPIVCEEDDDGLRQIFTKEIPQLGNLIIEIIERGEHGFCSSSVAKLMESTKK